jgi:hypothetical protein
MPAVPGSEPKSAGVGSPGDLVAPADIGMVTVVESLNPGRVRLSESAAQARRPAQPAARRNRHEVLGIDELKAAGDGGFRRTSSYASRFAAPIVVRSQTLTAHRQTLTAAADLTRPRATAAQKGRH